MRYQQIPLVLFLLLLCFGVGLTAQAQQNNATSADTYFNQGDWANVVSSYQEITRAEPKNGRAWYRLGFAYQKLGQYPQAIVAFQQLLAINSKNTNAMYNLACAQARNNNKTEALAWLDKAVQQGFMQIQLLETDQDLENLRGEARFVEIKQALDKKVRPCLSSPEAKQFQFWVGEWDVTVNGQPAGINNVQLHLDDCLIMENWTGAGGGRGKSFNFYNGVSGKWEQFWVDSQGNKVHMFGEYKDGEMRFTGETPHKDGSKVLERLTFSKPNPEQVRQLWEQSQDNGKTWQVVFDGLYKRRSN